MSHQQIRDHLKANGVDHSTAHSAGAKVMEKVSKMDPEDITQTVIHGVLRAGGVENDLARDLADDIVDMFN
jgi:hypothetical protein